MVNTGIGATADGMTSFWLTVTRLTSLTLLAFINSATDTLYFFAMLPTVSPMSTMCVVWPLSTCIPGCQAPTLAVVTGAVAGVGAAADGMTSFWFTFNESLVKLFACLSEATLTLFAFAIFQSESPDFTV